MSLKLSSKIKAFKVKNELKWKLLFIFQQRYRDVCLNSFREKTDELNNKIACDPHFQPNPDEKKKYETALHEYKMNKFDKIESLQIILK